MSNLQGNQPKDCWSGRYFSATLGILLPKPTGKTQPPWAEPHFSYRFTSLPPIEVYEEWGDVL